MYYSRLRASLPLYVILNYIYSENFTATTSGSVNLRSKIIYNVLMLPILIKSVFKHIWVTLYVSIIGSYYPTLFSAQLVNNFTATT